MLPGTEVAPTVAPHMKLAASPMRPGGSRPANAVRWDGFAIAANASEGDAEASFRVTMHAIAPELAPENPELAVWLVEGCEPTRAAAGVIASVQGGAPGYPTSRFMGLLATAIDGNLVEFMQGGDSAEQALAETACETAAREAGFIE